MILGAVHVLYEYILFIFTVSVLIIIIKTKKKICFDFIVNKMDNEFVFLDKISFNNFDEDEILKRINEKLEIINKSLSKEFLKRYLFESHFIIKKF